VPVVPAAPEDVVYGFGRIDASGRVADRAVASVLAWRAGDRLTLSAAAGVVTARRDPDGMVTMPSKPYIVIPAALRRRCGLRPGDRVLRAVDAILGTHRRSPPSVTGPARGVAACHRPAKVTGAFSRNAVMPA
jgi:hypothetical protein